MREGICMEKITVWTKQHKAVLETLEREGRYVAKRQFVEYENRNYINIKKNRYFFELKSSYETIKY